MGRKNFNGLKTTYDADIAASIYSVIDSLSQVLDERWHIQLPKTLQECAEEHLSRNERAKLPPCDQWKIE